MQKLPFTVAPHLGQVQPAAGAGLAVPQFVQKLPVAVAPQVGQVQPLAAGCAAGAGCAACWAAPIA